jgi:hypothetical protein
MLSKPFIPAFNSGVAETRNIGRTARTLTMLPTPNNLENLPIGEFATIKDGISLRTDLLLAGFTPAVVVTPGPADLMTATHALLALEVVDNLFAFTFTRYVC